MFSHAANGFSVNFSPQRYARPPARSVKIRFKYFPKRLKCRADGTFVMNRIGNKREPIPASTVLSFCPNGPSCLPWMTHPTCQRGFTPLGLWLESVRLIGAKRTGLGWKAYGLRGQKVWPVKISPSNKRGMTSFLIVSNMMMLFGFVGVNNL